MSDERTFFNEMLDETGAPRQPYARLAQWLEDKPANFLSRKSKDAETIFRRLGITFAVYGAEAATERLIPFDPIPRVISASEWRRLSAGIDQRVRALNAFLHDIYHRQEILRAGRIPADLILQNEAFLPEMAGFTPARKVYAHIIGTDLVRVSENEFYVLEDNTRTPSGVSYMMENRETMMDGARRETREEAGAELATLAPFALFDLPFISQVYMMFRGPLASTDCHPGEESLEVRLFAQADIPWNDLAFAVVRETLECYFRDRNRGQFQLHTGTIVPPPGMSRQPHCH